MGWIGRSVTAIALAAVIATQTPAADQPQWAQWGSRNNVSAETGLPESFEPGKPDPKTGEPDPATARGIKWTARVGDQTYGTPVIAEGRVLVSTNNGKPRDPRFTEDAGVLMCFDEKSGEFLWQLLVPKLFEIKYADWYDVGLCASPVVEKGRVYVMTNRAEVMCLDLAGMANGNDGPYQDEGRHMMPADKPAVVPGPRDADILWLCDTVGQLGVRPHNAANCSILLDGDFLYVCTSNGVEWTHNRVANPEAPTLIVLDKKTGRLIARDDFGIGANIIHGQWSSPGLAEVGGRRQGFQGTGSGYLYAFEMLDPTTLRDPPENSKPLLKTKNLWRFNGHPLAQTRDDVPLEHAHQTKSYEVVGNPVFWKGRLYVVFTQEGFHNQHHAWITCLDVAKAMEKGGDVTRSALVWSYDKLAASPSTPTVADGLVYVPDYDGHLHCLDAETGKCHWNERLGPSSSITGSPLVADGKLYLGTGREPQFWVLAPGKTFRVLARIEMPDRVSTTPVAANGVLYVSAWKHLYAIQAQKKGP